jgi:hypothetical protein
MIKIFLDDIRIPFDDTWIILTNYQAFIDRVGKISFNDIEIISLDHDLSDFDDVRGEKTGYDVAKWLVDQAMDRNENLPLIKVHSANPAGADNIVKYINGYLKQKKMAETTVCWIVDLKRGIRL